MEKVILIRYGELYLKGRNRGYFERALNKNIRYALIGLKSELLVSRSRTFIAHFENDDIDEIISRLQKVFGIHSLSVAIKVETNLEEIKKILPDFAPNEGTFRVSVNRADKKLPMNSISLASDFGGAILDQKPQLKVDLFKPDKNISIDIRENGTTYIYYETIPCADGMPVGTAGKGMLLLSGGIDSPVAGYMMAKRGMIVHGLHFHSFPYTSQLAKDKVVDLANIISDYCGSFNLFVVSFTKIQQAIHEFCREDFMITVMRRIMIRIAEKVASVHKCGALITGESLGQVASQTLESITCTNDAAEVMPIFRPLIGMDKSEIISISRKINTYETSIQPYEDCCTVFLPKNPVIHPVLATARSEEDKIPNLDELIKECVETLERIRISKE